MVASHVLSGTGSTRGTAYFMANKSVRIGERTAAVWLDAVARVCVAAFDHRRCAWSEPVVVDEGFDNHCNPCLTAAPDGRLRVAYGPHGFGGRSWNGGRFRVMQSRSASDWRTWEPLESVGYHATYASLLCDGDGHDHLLYRGGPAPCSTFYEQRDPGTGAWALTQQLTRLGGEPRYTFTGASLAVGPAGELYCQTMFYAGRAADPDARSRGVVVLRSVDHGRSWTAIDGTSAVGPIGCEPPFTVPAAGENPYAAGVVVAASGRVFSLTTDLAPSRGGLLLAWSDGGPWEHRNLEPALPEGWCSQQAQLTLTANRELLVVCDAVPRAALQAGAPSAFGHAANEVFLLRGDVGGAGFEAQQISPLDPTTPQWLGTISRPGPNHPVTSPLVLYTRGHKGSGCDATDRTQVHAVWV